MTEPSVAHFTAMRLKQWGVNTVYGCRADGIDCVVQAIERVGVEAYPTALRWIEAPQAALVGFMACAHAKFSSDVGVCIAAASDSLQLLNGLYDAAHDNVPVVVIIGQPARPALGAQAPGELDLEALFKDVAHHFFRSCTHPSQVPYAIDGALRVAKARRCVSCVIVPCDVQRQAYELESHKEHGEIEPGLAHARAQVIPAHDQLERAARLLNAAERPALLVGAGAAHAGRQVQELAEAIGAGVAKALLGKAVVPDTLTYVTGIAGMLGTEPSCYLLGHCDTLMLIGTNFPYPEWLPEPSRVHTIQLDIDPARLSARYPCEVNLWGDARLTLDLLRPMLHQTRNRGWGRQIEARVVDWWQLLEREAHRQSTAVHPEQVFWELSKQLPKDCIVTSDGGKLLNWYARELRFDEGMTGSVSGGLGATGAGLAYGLAAKSVHPERAVIVCADGGGLRASGTSALLSVAERQAEWENHQFVVLVLDPAASSAEARLPWARYAELHGFSAIEMRSSETVASGWERALRCAEPCLVVASVDADARFLPPHIDANRAADYWQALLQGNARRAHVARQTVKDLFADML